MNFKGAQRGFTLIETLVALFMFGIIAIAVLGAMQGSVHKQRMMEDRLAANWVAQQVLSQVRVQTPWPPIGEQTDQVTLGQREWEVRARVEATTNERLRHIIIEVGHLDAENPTLTLDAWAAEE
ncbi:type II secretion system minor pseudopilin GspI [Microbulbifer sp. ZKSA004]|uniref:type II secretion system minor pseudopilin GspI n=1 Tax=unclassified Microbulbifer TaxID=2619833 RepID=UPI0039B54F40